MDSNSKPQSLEKFSCDLTFNGECVGKVSVNIAGELAELHNEVYKWNKTIYQEFLLTLENIKMDLRATGVKRLMVCMYTDYPGIDKIIKYWKMMGFFSIKKIFINGREAYYADCEV